MGFGPLIVGAGPRAHAAHRRARDYVTDLLPALLIFSLGLSATVAPLTATVLADADESNAGIASGINNAIARVAGLLAVAALGAVVSAQFSLRARRSARRTDALAARASRGRAGAQGDARARGSRRVPGTEVAAAVQSASTHAFHVGIGISTVLVALGGVLGLAGIRNPRRAVRCEDCPGGQFAGQPLDSARDRPPLVESAPAPLES